MLTVLKKKLPSKCDNFAPKLQKKINKEMLITRILFCRWQKNIFLYQPLLLSFALFIVTLAHTNCPQQQVAIFTDCKSELLQTDNKNFPTAALIHTLRWILRKWGTLHSIACASLRIDCHNCLSEQFFSGLHALILLHIYRTTKTFLLQLSSILYVGCRANEEHSIP